MYSYRFPIGDWSGDGHEKCEWYVVDGKKPIEDVREAHFKCENVLGFDIGEICSDYRDREVDQDIQNKLIDEGLATAETFEDFWCEELLELWLRILNHIDPELKLKRSMESVPSINFYGFDEKERHLNVPGYGMFD